MLIQGRECFWLSYLGHIYILSIRRLRWQKQTALRFKPKKRLRSSYDMTSMSQPKSFITLLPMFTSRPI